MQLLCFEAFLFMLSISRNFLLSSFYGGRCFYSLALTTIIYIFTIIYILRIYEITLLLHLSLFVFISVHMIIFFFLVLPLNRWFPFNLTFCVLYCDILQLVWKRNSRHCNTDTMLLISRLHSYKSQFVIIAGTVRVSHVYCDVRFLVVALAVKRRSAFITRDSDCFKCPSFSVFVYNALWKYSWEVTLVTVIILLRCTGSFRRDHGSLFNP